MEIDRRNYEAYLLDLLEGRLSAEEQQKIRDFLLLNPDCAVGIDEVEPWILETSNIPFPAKEQLKKEFPDASFELMETNFDLFSIARLEGDLTKDQEGDHAVMVEKYEEKRNEWAEWQRTKLVSGNIIFTGKDQLKRRKGISSRVIWISIVSTAAVIALLFALLRIDQEAPEVELANEVGLPQPALEESSPFQTGDPIPQKEEAKVIQKNEESELLAESMNKSRQKDSELTTDNVKQVQQELIQPGTVRITSHVSGYADMVDKGTYDQIESLEIPSTSIHLNSLSLSQLAEIDLQEAIEDYSEENDFSIWTIADAGIKGINRLTGADISLLAARDEEGDVSGFRFKSKWLSIATPLDQSE